jgi:hypothetical protein
VDVEADSVEVIDGAGEHADDAAVVEHRDAERRPVAAAERPVGGAVGDDLERGDDAGQVADRADCAGDLRHVLRRIEGDLQIKTVGRAGFVCLDRSSQCTYVRVRTLPASLPPSILKLLSLAH